MAIQPGSGYTFSASSLGENLNILQPWSEWDSSVSISKIVQQYELSAKRVGFVDKLQLANGTVCFTQSNMPRVRQGGHYDQRQGYITKSAVFGAGVSVTPGTGSSVWMEDGGYYNIVNAGTYYVTISKFDITATFDDTDSTLLNEEAPFVSIFKASDPLQAKLIFETGPSEYVNFTNVQKMKGYDAESTGLSGDWGNCHTSWFNPVKWGYSVKLIGIVTATASVEGMRLTIDQHIVGPIDMQIPVLFNGTTLCNVPGMTETSDPYNTNKLSVPKWNNVVNNGKLLSIATIVPENTDWYQEFIGTADWTESNYSYLKVDGCINEDTCYPFRVRRNGYATSTVWEICPGSVNGRMPDPAFDTFECTDGFVWLKLWYDGVEFPKDAPYGITAENGATVPADTDTYGYIPIAQFTGDVVTQLVTGSLFADRIKLGSLTARYYYSRV
jgi:hypothetical protein